MDKFDWTYLTALFSVAFGWFLNEVGQWLRTRQDDKKIKKKILYNLLEINFIIRKLDISNMLKLTTERILLWIPKHEQTDEVKQYLNQFYSQIINNIIQDYVSNNLEGIEEKYINAVDSLASIDPIRAYRLQGKTKIFEAFALFDVYCKKVGIQFPSEIDQMQDTIENTMNFIKSEIVKQALEGVDDEIRDIAFSIDIQTWFKVRKSLKSTNEGVRKDVVKIIDEQLSKLIPSSK